MKELLAMEESAGTRAATLAATQVVVAIASRVRGEYLRRPQCCSSEGEHGELGDHGLKIAISLCGLNDTRRSRNGVTLVAGGNRPLSAVL